MTDCIASTFILISYKSYTAYKKEKKRKIRKLQTTWVGFGGISLGS